eukprot:gi/632954512/ref/XP_007893003.1/ PREDICTED: receptor-type tyrosine-protein phosphatase U-like [Callorhinchus milii]
MYRFGAILSLLTALHFTGIDTQSFQGRTFSEDSESTSMSIFDKECTFDEDAGPCDYVQGTDDDFDWELVRAHGGPHQSADLLRGEFLLRFPHLPRSGVQFNGCRAPHELLT